MANLLSVLNDFGIRKLVILLVFLSMGVIYFMNRRKHQQRKRTKKRVRREVKNFEKDENGLYPWETDTDDSPSRIAANAKPIKIDKGPKRGGWRV